MRFVYVTDEHCPSAQREVSLVDLSKSCKYSVSARCALECVPNKHPAISQRYRAHHIQGVSLNVRILHQAVSSTIHKWSCGRVAPLPKHLHSYDHDNSIHLPREPGHIPSTCRLARRSICGHVTLRLTRNLPDG